MTNKNNTCYVSDTSLIRLSRVKTRNTSLRNLQLRNGIFYLRCTIDKHVIYKSLNTDNPFLARLLADQYLQRILSSTAFPQDTLPPAVQFPCFSRISNSQYDQLIQDPLGANMPRTKKHKIIDVWDSIPHNATPLYLSTCRTRLIRTINLLGTEYIEDLDKEPVKITNMIDSLPKLVQTEGKNKGQPISKKVTLETLKVLRTTVIRAYDLGYVKNKTDILDKIHLPKYIEKGLKAKEQREPFSESDLRIIFRDIMPLFMEKIKLNKFKKAVSAINPTNPKEKEYKTHLERVAKYPYVFFYYILICLFTGSRANAVATLRYKDIEFLHKHKYFYFHIDKNLVAQGDIREKAKQLKGERNDLNPDAERKVPIAHKIYRNGLAAYLAKHKKKYGEDAFIFEEAIITNKDTYRPKNIPDSINALLKFHKIKPAPNSGTLKDVHSFKTGFFSYNITRINDILLQVIAGNKPISNNIVTQHYTRVSYDNNMKDLEDAVNDIRYPHDYYLYLDIAIISLFIVIYLGFPI